MTVISGKRAKLEVRDEDGVWREITWSSVLTNVSVNPGRKSPFRRRSKLSSKRRRQKRLWLRAHKVRGTAPLTLHFLERMKWGPRLHIPFHDVFPILKRSPADILNGRNLQPQTKDPS